ncbi:MAG: PQQ-dependent sugar dehydrogenase [Ilumatobacteraceae bacterium]
MTRALPRRAFLVTFLLAAVAQQAPAATAASPGYSLRKVASVPGAVRVVERSSTDPFVYVVSRRGQVVRMHRDGSRRTRVLDVSSLTTTESERGLLGLAFRRIATGWEAFANYTDTDGDTVVARWRVRPDGTFVRQPGGRPSVVIRIDQPYSNHNGGDLQVGPDRMLYIGMGDGGAGGDPGRRAGNPAELLGKILRIDPTPVTNGGGRAYRIPAGNPFVGRGRGEIWSTGVRNPWRFVFDARGNLWVADVGQNEIEEVSVARAGSRWPGGRGTNFGWSAWEGTARYNDDVNGTGALPPVHEYRHASGRCSVSGAAVATSRAVPTRAGWFFFADFCSGEVWALPPGARLSTKPELVADDAGNVTSVSGTSRELWYTTLDGAVGTVRSS